MEEGKGNMQVSGQDVAPLSVEAPAAAEAPVASTSSVRQSTSGLAIAGLVLGILAILGAFIPLLNIFTAPFAVVGLILAIVGLLGINKGKHTGKGIAVAGVVLGAAALVVTLGMYGCAGAIAGSSNSGSSSSSSEAASSSSSSQSSAVENPSSAAASDGTPSVDASVMGRWEIVDMMLGDDYYNSDDLDLARGTGKDIFAQFTDDGQFAVILGSTDNAFKGTWVDSGSGYLELATEDSTGLLTPTGDTAYMEFNLDGGNSFSFNLAKAGSKAAQDSPDSAGSAESQKEADAAKSEPASSDADSGEVSPDVKEALDSYEAVMDEYVAFMKEYKASGNAASMLSDYTEMLQKYTEFSSKINAMDTENMSKADYAYYIEVTSRVSQKLLEVM